MDSTPNKSQKLNRTVDYDPKNISSPLNSSTSNEIDSSKYFAKKSSDKMFFQSVAPDGPYNNRTRSDIQCKIIFIE